MDVLAFLAHFVFYFTCFIGAAFGVFAILDRLDRHR